MHYHRGYSPTSQLPSENTRVRACRTAFATATFWGPASTSRRVLRRRRNRRRYTPTPGAVRNCDSDAPWGSLVGGNTHVVFLQSARGEFFREYSTHSWTRRVRMAVFARKRHQSKEVFGWFNLSYICNLSFTHACQQNFCVGLICLKISQLACAADFFKLMSVTRINSQTSSNGFRCTQLHRNKWTQINIASQKIPAGRLQR